MVHPLIGVHAALGEIAGILFVWIFAEILNPTEKRLKRAQKLALVGSLFFVLSWITGGYYYVKYYGTSVKALIKEGPSPWAHSIIMETKEHIFLLLPFIAIFTYLLIKYYSKDIIKNKSLKKATLLLCLLTFLISMSMAFMGYLISTAARLALEVKVL